MDGITIVFAVVAALLVFAIAAAVVGREAHRLDAVAHALALEQPRLAGEADRLVERRASHADRHGAVIIPHDVARELPKAAELCGKREAPILKVARSADFYQRLGFELSGGDGETYAMLRNPRGGATLGLFQGLFEGNVLTFNPGLDPAGARTSSFDDVRDLQARWQALGIELQDEAAPSEDGPAHVTLLDPDGNAILVDQFWPRPG